MALPQRRLLQDSYTRMNPLHDILQVLYLTQKLDCFKEYKLKYIFLKRSSLLPKKYLLH